MNSRRIRHLCNLLLVRSRPKDGIGIVLFDRPPQRMAFVCVKTRDALTPLLWWHCGSLVVCDSSLDSGEIAGKERSMPRRYKPRCVE